MAEQQQWWSGEPRAPGLDSHFHHGWAQIGLVYQALNGGEPVIGRYQQSSLKEDQLPEGVVLEEAESMREAAFVAKFQADFTAFRLVENESATHWSFAAKHGMVKFEFDGDAKVSYNVVSNDSSFQKHFKRWWDANTTKIQPKGRVHVLISTKNGPDFKSLGIGGEALTRDNYPPDVLSGYDRIVRDLQAENPSGRVSILDGKPGTGKTYLVRGLLDEVKNVVMVIVPANLVQQLAQPGMIPALVDLHKRSDGRPIVFLIEDADEVLAPRMGDNMSAVSTILNLGDGILGKLLDIRIVCTTNAKHTELDEAILRPGRLSANVHVGALEWKWAQRVYARLVPNGKLPEGKYTLAEIYSKARDDGWEPPRNPKGELGFKSSTPDDDDDDYYDVVED